MLLFSIKLISPIKGYIINNQSFFIHFFLSIKNAAKQKAIQRLLLEFLKVLVLIYGFHRFIPHF